MCIIINVYQAPIYTKHHVSTNMQLLQCMWQRGLSLIYSQCSFQTLKFRYGSKKGKELAEILFLPVS